MEERYYYTAKRDVVNQSIDLILEVVGFFFVKALMNWCKPFVQLYEMAEYELIVRIILWMYMGFFIICHINEIISIYLRKRYMELIIRRDEIVFCRGFFTKKKTAVPMNRIKDCSTESGPLQQICGTMTLSVTTAGDQQEICFTNIANGEKAERLIRNLIR